MLSLLLSTALASEIAVTLSTPVKIKVNGRTVHFDLAEGQAVDRQLEAGTYDVEVFTLLGGKLATLDVDLGDGERVELRYSARQLTLVDRVAERGTTAVQDFESDLQSAADDLGQGVKNLLGGDDTGNAHAAAATNPTTPVSSAAASTQPAAAATNPAASTQPPAAATTSPAVGESAHASGPVLKTLGPAEAVDLSTLAVLVLDGLDQQAAANIDGAGLPYEGDAWQLAGLPPGVYALSFEVEGSEQLFPVTLAAGRTTRCTWQGGGLGCAFE